MFGKSKGGSIVWERRRQDYCLIFLWLKAVCCQQLQYFKLVILIYVYSIFTSHMCLWYRLVLLFFSLIINICYDLFNELCKYIMYNCRLILFSICWCMSCCKYDNWYHNICDICVYHMILLVSEFLLNTFKIINTVVPLVGSISG